MYNPNAKRRRIKPYARPTSFDYNVRFDIRQYHDVKYNRVKKPFFMSASNDEVFRVMEGELLVKSNSPNARYNDKELHVFSFANGLTAPANSASGAPERTFNGPTQNSIVQQRDLRRSILNTIQYMGVAVTEFSPARDVYEQGFVATIAGLNTLYNNGADTIFPGQTVCLDLPIIRAGDSSSSSTHYKRATQMGVPRDKLQFIVRPHSEMLKDYGEGSLSLVNRFIVGTAISYSRPGDTVDIILHRMNYTSSSVGGVAPQGGYGNNSGPSQHLSGLMLKVLGGDDSISEENLQIIENAISDLSPDVKKAYARCRGAAGIDALMDELAKDDALARASALKGFAGAGLTVAVTAAATADALAAEISRKVKESRDANGPLLLSNDEKNDLFQEAANVALFAADGKNGIENAGFSKKALQIHQVAVFLGALKGVANAATALTAADAVLGKVGDKATLHVAQKNDVEAKVKAAGNKFGDDDLSTRRILKMMPGGATSTSAPGISAAVGAKGSGKKKTRK